MKTKYRTMYHIKSMTKLIHYYVFMKMKNRRLYRCNVFMKIKYRTSYHMKSITEINTLPCLHENEVQNIVSHEKHNRKQYTTMS